MKEEAEYGKWKGAVRASELGNWVHILSHILSTNDLCNTLESRGESEREREGTCFSTTADYGHMLVFTPARSFI